MCPVENSALCGILPIEQAGINRVLCQSQIDSVFEVVARKSPVIVHAVPRKRNQAEAALLGTQPDPAWQGESPNGANYIQKKKECKDDYI